MADRTIAYLTSVYARAGDTFIRREVIALRELGYTVHTFSIRRAPASELVGEDIRSEYATTEYLLPGPGKFVPALIKQALRAPGATLRALRLAKKVCPPGLKAKAWHIAYILEAAYLGQQMRKKGVRHVHVHLGQGCATVGMLAAEMTGITWSMTIHGPAEFDCPEYIGMGPKIHHAAYTVAISSFAKSQLCRWAAVEDWPRIHVVHCGLNRVFFEVKPTTPPAAPRLLCVGRLCKEKAQELLVQAAAKLRDEGLTFEIVLVGDGPTRPTLERLIAQERLEKHVILAGWKNTDQIIQMQLDSRGLVLPSFAEGLPAVIMESMALHRPCISTYIAAIPELVIPGKTGWLVAPSSVDELADAIRDAVTAPVERIAAMGAAGAALAFKQHDVAKQARKLGKLLDATLGIAPRSQTAEAVVATADNIAAPEPALAGDKAAR